MDIRGSVTSSSPRVLCYSETTLKKVSRVVEEGVFWEWKCPTDEVGTINPISD